MRDDIKKAFVLKIKGNLVLEEILFFFNVYDFIFKIKDRLNFLKILTKM